MGWSLSYKLTSWFINLLYNSQEGRSVRIWGAHWSKENSWAATYQVWTHRGHSRKHLLVSSHFTLLRARRKIRWLDGFTFLPRASKTLSRRCSAPSPHRKGAWGLREQSKPSAGALLAFCVNQGILASLSLLYLLIGRLRTTRFRSIKGPQHLSSLQPQSSHWLLLPLFPASLAPWPPHHDVNVLRAFHIQHQWRNTPLQILAHLLLLHP